MRRGIAAAASSTVGMRDMAARPLANAALRTYVQLAGLVVAPGGTAIPGSDVVRKG